MSLKDKEERIMRRSKNGVRERDGKHFRQREQQVQRS